MKRIKKLCIVKNNKNEVLFKQEYNTDGLLTLLTDIKTHDVTLYKYNNKGNVCFYITSNITKSCTYEKWFNYDKTGEKLLSTIDSNGVEKVGAQEELEAPIDIKYNDNGDISYKKYNNIELFYEYEYYEDKNEE